MLLQTLLFVKININIIVFWQCFTSVREIDELPVSDKSIYDISRVDFDDQNSVKFLSVVR